MKLRSIKFTSVSTKCRTSTTNRKNVQLIFIVTYIENLCTPFPIITTYSEHWDMVAEKIFFLFIFFSDDKFVVAVWQFSFCLPVAPILGYWFSAPYGAPVRVTGRRAQQAAVPGAPATAHVGRRARGRARELLRCTRCCKKRFFANRKKNLASQCGKGRPWYWNEGWEPFPLSISNLHLRFLISRIFISADILLSLSPKNHQPVMSPPRIKVCLTRFEYVGYLNVRIAWTLSWLTNSDPKKYTRCPWCLSGLLSLPCQLIVP